VAVPALTCDYIPFSNACAKLPWVRRGLRFTVSLRTGVVFLGGRKTADFLGDRTSVCVMSGSGTATLKSGRKPAGIIRTALRRKNSSIDDFGQAGVT